MNESGAVRSLRRRVAGVGAVAWVGLVVGYALLSGVIAARPWALVAAAVVGAELVYLRRHVGANRASRDAPLRARLGVANLATVGRGALLGGLAGFVTVAWTGGPAALAWLPAGLYALAATLDYADGTLARSVGAESRLGARLDAEFDALGVLVGAAVGATAGQVPVWYCAVGLAKYGYVAARWLRLRRGLPVAPLPPRASRRVLAGLQMAFLAAALSPALVPEAAYAYAPLVGGAYLVGFLRDWGHTTGRLPAALSPPAQAGRPDGSGR